MSNPVTTARTWAVGALCRAVADALEVRFNPVAVRGEISGFSRAASGHCYFTLKDENGQLRCAMFRRAAGALDFMPRDGEQVELRGRLGVYEARGDLQLIVESMTRAGQGALFEQFLQRKARLEAQGLFDAERKRALPTWPRAIGVVTSLGAAALHDVISALQRRVPHIPVVVAPAAVQGAGAPDELLEALSNLYRLTQAGRGLEADLPENFAPVDVILLVRGGGSLEDLWAFNDERLVQHLARSPVPVISGVGHETDFTLADFVADVRAPTPTAAAELAALPRADALQALAVLQARWQRALLRRLESQQQRLDQLSTQLGRPSVRLARQAHQLDALAQRLRQASIQVLRQCGQGLRARAQGLPEQVKRGVLAQQQRLDRLALRLELLDPTLVLQRGYAWVSDAQGRAVTQAQALRPGQALHVHLAQGQAEVQVTRTESK